MILLTAEDLTSEDISATIYHLGLFAKYGPAMYSWEPRTMWMEIESDYGVDAIDEVKDKIQAVCTINSIDSFARDSSVFRSVCLALNHQSPEFEIAGPTDIVMLAWALDEIKRNCHYTPKYDQEVLAYVRTCLLFYQFLEVPGTVLKYMPKLDYKPPELPPEISSNKSVQLEASFRVKRVEAYVALQRENLTKRLELSV